MQIRMSSCDVEISRRQAYGNNENIVFKCSNRFFSRVNN